jgi:hypothetical protein
VSEARELEPDGFWAHIEAGERELRAAPPRRMLAIEGWSGPAMLAAWNLPGDRISLLFGRVAGDGWTVTTGGRPIVARPDGEVVVPVDGEPVRFALRVEGGELEVRRAVAPGIEIEARGYPIRGLRLVTVTDLEPYIAGRRDHIVQRRRESGLDPGP